MLKSQNRIKKGSDIVKIIRQGTWINGRWLTVHYRPGNEEVCRWGIVVSKKVGGAVIRNRSKRRIRELCRAIQPELKLPLDLVVIGRKDSDRIAFSDLRKDFIEICRKGRLREGGRKKRGVD